jgi:membrane associated rhomboid family serine protease
MNRTPAVFLLLGVNTLIFLLETTSGSRMIGQLALWPIDLSGQHLLAGAYAFHPWQLLTYGFLHGSVLHLFLNMYALWLFGRSLETSLGSQRFLLFYLTCVVGAALAHLLVQSYLISHGVTPRPVIGASGGTFGLLMAFAYLFPDVRLFLLIPPMPVKAKWFALGYGIIELVVGVTGTASGLAHFAHLGGMVTAYLLLRYWIAAR